MTEANHLTRWSCLVLSVVVLWFVLKLEASTRKQNTLISRRESAALFSSQGKSDEMFRVVVQDSFFTIQSLMDFENRLATTMGTACVPKDPLSHHARCFYFFQVPVAGCIAPYRPVRVLFHAVKKGGVLEGSTSLFRVSFCVRMNNCTFGRLCTDCTPSKGLTSLSSLLFHRLTPYE